VDDIPAVKDFIVDTLKPEYEVTGATSGNEALEILSNSPVDLIIADLAMPDMAGEELTLRVKEKQPNIPVLAVTAYSNVEGTTNLMKLGAFDYIEKPFTAKRLKHMIEKAFEFASLKSENRVLQDRLRDQERVKNLVGNSVQLQHVREKIDLVAKTNANVLVSGESGVGKELVAGEIHRLSDRAGKPLVRVNCTAIPPSLLEGELFGHEDAGYGGAVNKQTGKLELADNGTILLDEIGGMDQIVQAKLLRVIQECEFERVGGNTPVKVNVRIIATTARNLREEISKNRFREDLFYRLNVVPLEIPPLRERRDDIPLLISHFIDLFSRKNNTERISLSEKAMDKLCNAYWAGNVRQLQNVIERAVVLRGGQTLDADYFQFENERQEQLSIVERAFRFGTIREMEKLMIMNRLKEQSNNRTRSAETLDISVRTLRNKLNEYNVPKKREQLLAEQISPVSG
jgi:DNA-binding NtrC family response regulator